MKSMMLICVTAAALFSNSAMANADLAKAKNCMACHTVNSKLIGPAFKDVAAKYAGQNAEAALSKKVVKGGSGVWGTAVMPANPQVTEAEAQTLVKWIMTLK